MRDYRNQPEPLGPNWLLPLIVAVLLVAAFIGCRPGPMEPEPTPEPAASCQPTAASQLPEGPVIFVGVTCEE